MRRTVGGLALVACLAGVAPAWTGDRFVLEVEGARVWSGRNDVVEGGADNDEVCTFAWIHYATVGVTAKFSTRCEKWSRRAVVATRSHASRQRASTLRDDLRRSV
jgi:hypothetical protein